MNIKCPCGYLHIDVGGNRFTCRNCNRVFVLEQTGWVEQDKAEPTHHMIAVEPDGTFTLIKEHGPEIAANYPYVTWEAGVYVFEIRDGQIYDSWPVVPRRWWDRRYAR